MNMKPPFMYLKLTVSMRMLLVGSLVVLTCQDSWAQARRSDPRPKVQTVAQGVLWRSSDNKDSQGNALPPWTEVHVTNIWFKRAPTIGTKVTILPLGVELPLQDLTIVKTKRGDGCDDSVGDVRWEIELEAVKQKRYFEISSPPDRRPDVPFDVAIIYPAVKSARSLSRSELNKKLLPPSIYIETVKAAIDLTDDGVADALLVEYCCLSPRKAPGECDYTCGKTFQKFGSQWKLVDTSSPC